jgi:hypothetical protein
LLEHAVRILQNIVVPKTENAKTALSQISIAPLITFAFQVLTAVSFDNQFLSEAHEIYDPRAERNLATKLDVRELARSKQFPKLLLRVSRVTPQLPRIVAPSAWNAILRHLPLTRRASRATLSHEGRG